MSPATDPLAPLVGEWEGTGRVFFPTIPTVGYRDHIVVKSAGRSVYHYLQQTWKKTPEGEAESHRETGFITVEEDGGVEMLGAHGTDRVEVLRGRVEGDTDRVRLELRSVLIGGDPRVIGSWRSIIVSGNTLSYTMGMATDRVPDGEEHLSATLSRITS